MSKKNGTMTKKEKDKVYSDIADLRDNCLLRIQEIINQSFADNPKEKEVISEYYADRFTFAFKKKFYNANGFDINNLMEQKQ